MTSNASTAPVNVHSKILNAGPRVGGFNHNQEEMIASPSSEIMIATVGSEKPPRMNATNKPSGYFQYGRRVCAAEDMEFKMKAARYGIKTRGAKCVAIEERQYNI